MLEDPETVLEDPGTVAVSLPLSSRADGLFLPSTPYGWPSSVGLAVLVEMEELDGEKWRSCCGWWRQLMSLMVATDQHLRRAGKNRWLDLPVRVLAVIDGHSSADGGRYGLWVWLSVVKKDKRFLKGEGYGL
uniref:Uncharacterized protein n=1 Tax=Populus alba TaxID=43335 RepID=A0A4U5MIG5_POPAL|nr:hypothetical protein D5086_0000309320 [Populus alba]